MNKPHWYDRVRRLFHWPKWRKLCEDKKRFWLNFDAAVAQPLLDERTRLETLVESNTLNSAAWDEATAAICAIDWILGGEGYPPSKLVEHIQNIPDHCRAKTGDECQAEINQLRDAIDGDGGWRDQVATLESQLKRRDDEWREAVFPQSDDESSFGQAAATPEGAAGLIAGEREIWQTYIQQVVLLEKQKKDLEAQLSGSYKLPTGWTNIATSLPQPTGEPSLERLTDRARKVLVLADKEAKYSSSSEVTPYHLLIALIAEGNGIAGTVLKNLGLSTAQLRSPPGTVSSSTEKTPHSNSVKAILLAAIKAAKKRGHNYVGTEHLLYGLLEDSHGRILLETAGVTAETVEKAIDEMLGVDNKLTDYDQLVLLIVGLFEKHGITVTTNNLPGDIENFLSRVTTMQKIQEDLLQLERDIKKSAEMYAGHRPGMSLFDSINKALIDGYSLHTFLRRQYKDFNYGDDSKTPTQMVQWFASAVRGLKADVKAKDELKEAAQKERDNAADSVLDYETPTFISIREVLNAIASGMALTDSKEWARFMLDHFNKKAVAAAAA